MTRTALWISECPMGDQGLVRPMITTEGVIVLFCDSVDTVWRSPQDLADGVFFEPVDPDWKIGDDLHIVPGTTRWATRADLTDEPWASVDWHETPGAG